jgi:hypothetical protein
MKRARLMATVALAGAGVMTIAAQETRTPAGGNTTGDQNRTTQQTPTTQTPSNQAAAGTTTITGCIQSSGEGAARTYTLMANAAGTGSGSGATAGSGASSTSGAGATAGARTEGAAGQSSRAGMTTYTLEGNEVAKHVGHQVEITGTLASSTTGSRAGNTTGAAGANDRSSAVGTSGADGDRQTLRVTSVKMLSTTCSR